MFWHANKQQVAAYHGRVVTASDTALVKFCPHGNRVSMRKGHPSVHNGCILGVYWVYIGCILGAYRVRSPVASQGTRRRNRTEDKWALGGAKIGRKHYENTIKIARISN